MENSISPTLGLPEIIICFLGNQLESEFGQLSYNIYSCDSKRELRLTWTPAFNRSRTKNRPPSQKKRNLLRAMNWRDSRSRSQQNEKTNISTQTELSKEFSVPNEICIEHTVNQMEDTINQKDNSDHESMLGPCTRSKIKKIDLNAPKENMRDCSLNDVEAYQEACMDVSLVESNLTHELTDDEQPGIGLSMEATDMHFCGMEPVDHDSSSPQNTELDSSAQVSRNMMVNEQNSESLHQDDDFRESDVHSESDDCSDIHSESDGCSEDDTHISSSDIKILYDLLMEFKSVMDKQMADLDTNLSQSHERTVDYG